MTEPPQLTTEPRFSATVRPLTKCKADGSGYERVPVVQEAIEAVAGLTMAEVLERSQTLDTSAAGYIPPECLVYFVREAHRAGQPRFASSFMKVLLERCTRQIQGWLQSLALEDSRHAFDDVVGDVAGVIIDLSHDKGDFFQIRFMRALKCRCTSTWKSYSARANLTAGHLHLGSGGTDADDPGLELDVADPRSAAPVEVAARREACQEALRQLPGPLRELLILKASGWPIESKDPDTPSLSSHFGVTPRTIQNRLTKADELLEQWRERQQS